MSISAVAEILAENSMEPARWRQLADLENRARIRLERVVLIDVESARREAAEHGALPPEVTKITVLATPDPTPLAIDAPRNIASHTPIEIAIQAPESRTNHFDIWGRPITDLWITEKVDIPEPLNTVHLSANPSSQAELATKLLSHHEQPAGLVALGVPDEEIIAPLGRELEAHGFAGFNPAGEPLQNHEVFYLLRIVADLLAARPYAAFAQLIRIPDFIHAVAAQYEQERSEPYDYLAVLRNFDSLHNANLPDTLEHVQDANSKRRLSWAAAIQAKERAAGWEIIDVEWAVPRDEHSELPTWQIAGHPIACKIDRIERHDLTGDLRVLDFKTSDKADSPYNSHFEKIPWGMDSSAFPDWTLATGPDGYPRHWVNLQLPLYILALRENHPAAAQAENIITGYFKLPRAKSDTNIDLWEDLNANTLTSAQNCAVKAVENIKNQVFWPPTEKVRYDDFKKILFEDPKASVKAPEMISPAQ